MPSSEPITVTFRSGRTFVIEAPPKELLARRQAGERVRPKPQPGLGDWTEIQLRRMGITEEWYKHVKENFGLDPNCSCPERKEWLNMVSDWWRGESNREPTEPPPQSE